MKWKTKIKRTATTTSAILLALMLTACSDNNGVANTPTPTNDNNLTEQGTIPNDTLPDQTGVLEPGTLTPEEDKNSAGETETDAPASDNGSTEQSVSDVISAKGTYIGAADGHSVEIQVGSETIVFQIDDDLTYIIDEFESDQAVKIEYVEKPIEGLDIKQPWLTSIEKE